jgi:cytochrome P450
MEGYGRSQDLLSWMGDQFRLYGNIYKTSVYGGSVYVTRDPEHAQHVLRDNAQNYKKGLAIKRVALLLGNGLMVSEGEFWKTQRRMIQPSFHRRMIAGLLQNIKIANAKLLKKWEQAASERASVNVTRDVSHTILEIVLIAIFGSDYEQVAPHFNILSAEQTRDLEFAAAFASLGKIVLQIAAQRRGRKAINTDILGMLMEARDEKSGRGMPDHQLFNEIKTLVVAGHETTAGTLNWIWYLLSLHPHVEQELWNEIDSLPRVESASLEDLPRFRYGRQVIEEVLRLYPAGWLVTRRAMKEDQLGAYFVPKGTEVYIPIYFIQRHPDLWREPDRFNPLRFSVDRSTHQHRLVTLPFSDGPRNCIGEFLARTEIEIQVLTIARHLRLKTVEGIVPELEAGVNLRSRHDFIMVPEFRPSGQ